MEITQTKSPFQKLWLLPVITGVFIAATAPEEVMSYLVAEKIIYFMSLLIPMVSKLEGNYQLSQVAQLYFSVMWLMSPLFFISVLKGGQIDIQKLVLNSKQHKLFMFCFCCLLLPGLILFSLNVSLDPAELEGRSYLTLNSRWGLATLGFLLPNGASAALAVIVAWASNLKKIY